MWRNAFIHGSFISRDVHDERHELKMHVLGTVCLDFTRIDPVRNVVVQGTCGTVVGFTQWTNNAEDLGQNCGTNE